MRRNRRNRSKQMRNKAKRVLSKVNVLVVPIEEIIGDGSGVPSFNGHVLEMDEWYPYHEAGLVVIWPDRDYVRPGEDKPRANNANTLEKGVALYKRLGLNHLLVYKELTPQGSQNER